MFLFSKEKEKNELTTHFPKNQYAFIICRTTRTQHQHQASTRRIDEGLRYLYDVVESKNPGSSITLNGNGISRISCSWNAGIFVINVVRLFFSIAPFLPFFFLFFLTTTNAKRGERLDFRTKINYDWASCVCGKKYTGQVP